MHTGGFLSLFYRLLSVVSLNVDRTDGRAENADLGALCAGFENKSLVLDGNNTADNTAGGSDLIADSEAVAHLVCLLFLLLLGTVNNKIEEKEKSAEHDKSHPGRTCGRRGSSIAGGGGQ